MSQTTANPRPPALTDTFAVLDFETNGLPPAAGGRAVEIGAVVVSGGKLVASFQGLMNPGGGILPFAAELTGISNQMIAKAPRNAEVIRDFADKLLAKFPGIPLIAHNAAFDRQVLSVELAHAKLDYDCPVDCSMLMARRVYPSAPDHKLGTLVAYAQIPTDGTYHRALADAMLTARLMMRMAASVRRRYEIENVPISLLQSLAKVGLAKADDWLAAQSQYAKKALLAAA